MNHYKRIRRYLAVLLSVVIAMGLMPIMEKASASTTTVKVTQIAAAMDNSIALKSDGTVIVWGENVTTWAKPPEGLKDVVEIYAKDQIFLARKSNGTVVAWGANYVGERDIPNGLSNVISMASAGMHTLMLVETSTIQGTGTVIAWGNNYEGQSIPPEAAKSGVVKVAAGNYYSMALKFNGTVVEWGSNGPGATSMPAGLSNVMAIDAGYLFALALKNDGTVVAWGQEDRGNGILGVPSELQGETIAISAQNNHALALKRDGTVVGWGTDTRGKATPPAGLKDVVAIAAGISHSLALKRDGTVVSWGEQTSVPGDNELSGLTLAEGEPTTAFSPSVTSYHYDIAPGATSVQINAVLKDTDYSALYINDQLQPSGQTVAVPVPTTGAVIKVRVEPYMKAPKTYTLTVSRDRVKPDIAISPNGSTAPLRLINAGATVTDATSGVVASTLEYAWTQTASSPVVGWTRFSFIPYTSFAQFVQAGADGKWYLHIRAKDNAGNSAEVTSAPFLIDNTPPVLSLTAKEADGNDYANNTWTNKEIKVTAAATDAQTGITLIRYSLDGGKVWTTYSDEPITLNTSGVHTITFQAFDTIGNVTTASRIVKISTGDLKLTPTMTRTNDGGVYTSGEWTNNNVLVSATVETGEHAITSFTSSLNGEAAAAYTGGSTIAFFQEGMNSIVFKVTDALDNSLSAPLAINIDKTKPTVIFSPNGNGSSARKASVTATVADSGGSGLVESTLEYVWTQSDTSKPTEGWQQLNNGSALTKEGVDGDWYLHLQGKDTAGNEVHAVSGRFVLDNSPLDSSISPNTGSFDKKLSAQAVVETTLSLNGNELDSINDGTRKLVSGTDYAIAGNTVIIQKSYLVTQPVGTTSLRFTFNGGADQTLTIAVSDTTPLNSTISPDIGSYDKKTSAQADIETTLTLNGNTLVDISNGGIALEYGTDYTVSGDTVTILKSYLATQPLGITSLTFKFSAGEKQTLILSVTDTTVTHSMISPNTGSFDKKTSAQADIETTLTQNGNTLTGISNGASVLVSGTDYTVMGNTVTILKSYLAAQPVGTTSLTFTFSGGADQTLTITVSDTTVPNSTISPNTGSFAKKDFEQADVVTTLRLNGNTLAGISNGAAALVSGTDYTVMGNTVTILKSYLAAQLVGTTSLTFTFSGGADQTLTITVSDTTVPDSTLDKYTVTYNGNGTTSGSTPTDSGSYAQGVTVSVYGNTGNLSKRGYTFAGWNTQTDGDGMSYAAGATFTMGTSNVTLYAKWKSSNADLSDLTLSGSTLNSTFAATTTSYTANVTNSMSRITITATLHDAVYATVTATVYNNAGTITSGPITLTNGDVSSSFPLNVGRNFINLVVTAQDGTTKTYVVTVNRASSGGNGGSSGSSTPPSTIPSDDQVPDVPTKEPSTDTNPAITFSDIAGHWAEAHIKQAVRDGIVTGYPDGTFKPNHTVTRAEFTVMLMNMLKLPGEGTALTFTDTAKIGSWAQKAVAQAVQTGIISGYEDGSFRPDVEIARVEMAVMLANASRLSVEANAATGFADDRNIPTWAKGAVSVIKKLGIIQGKDSNEFDPNASTTRAEAVTVLMRMLAPRVSFPDGYGNINTEVLTSHEDSVWLHTVEV